MRTVAQTRKQGTVEARGWWRRRRLWAELAEGAPSKGHEDRARAPQPLPALRTGGPPARSSLDPQPGPPSLVLTRARPPRTPLVSLAGGQCVLNARPRPVPRVWGAASLRSGSVSGSRTLSAPRAAESGNRIRGGSPPGLAFRGVTSSSSSPGATWAPAATQRGGSLGLLFIPESLVCFNLSLPSFLCRVSSGPFRFGGKKGVTTIPLHSLQFCLLNS